jgi:hypothetical protein
MHALILQLLYCSVITSPRDHLDTIMALLPHMLLDVLRFGSDRDRSCILEEITCVLRYDPAGAGAAKAAMAQTCTQTIFWLLDSLLEWIEKQSRLVSAARVERSRLSRQAAATTTAQAPLVCKRFERSIFVCVCVCVCVCVLVC